MTPQSCGGYKSDDAAGYPGDIMDKRTYSSRHLEPNITWTVDLGKCTGSGECVQACPMKILVISKDGKADCIDIETCISCCACVNACPRDAIVHSAC